MSPPQAAIARQDVAHLASLQLLAKTFESPDFFNNTFTIPFVHNFSFIDHNGEKHKLNTQNGSQKVWHFP